MIRLTQLIHAIVFFSLLLGPAHAQVGGPPTFFLGGGFPNPILGQGYSSQVFAVGGVRPLTYSIESGALPPGLSFNSSGVLFGTPTQTGQYNFFIKVTDASGATTRTQFIVDVAGGQVDFVQTSLPPGQVGQDYYTSITTTNGNVPLSMSRSAGAFPPGITITGPIPQWGLSGVPTVAGTFVFTLTAWHSSFTVIERQFTIQVAATSSGVGNPLGIRTNALPNGALTQAYGVAMGASGGSPPYTYRLVSGQLPNGLTLLPNGAINGTSAALGRFDFSVEVRDSTGATVTGNFSISILSPTPLRFLTAGLAGGVVGGSYMATLTAEGGVAPYQFQLSSGSLPLGLTLSPNGTISGTPLGSGPSTFTLRVVDSANNSVERTFLMTILSNNNQSAPVFLTPLLPPASAGSPYSTTIIAGSSATPLVFQVVSGNLANGLSLSPSGVLSGTPLNVGAYTFTVRVSDSTGNSAQNAYTLDVRPTGGAEALVVLPVAVLNQFYSTQLTTSGNNGPHIYEIEGGQYPVALTLSRSGLLSGIPRFAGNNSFSVRVTDSRGASVLRPYQLNVQLTSSNITVEALPEVRAGAAYTGVLIATGGKAPYAFSILSGTLPAGLSLIPETGRIIGTTGSIGRYTVTFRVRDADGVQADAVLTLVVSNTVSLTTNVTQIPEARWNEPFSFNLAGSGGTPPYTYVLLNGSLPNGIQLTAQGSLNGIPTQSGTFPLSLRITDSTGVTGQISFSLTVRAGLPSIRTLTLPSGTVNAIYNSALAASSPATLALTFRVSGGALPGGLQLNTNGTISGTPSLAGRFAFTVQVTDAQGGSSQREFLIEITAGGGPLSIVSVAPPSGRIYYNYNFRLAGAGGFPPYSWRLLSGTLPSGVRLDPISGEISGVALSHGFYTVSFRLTDSQGAVANAPPYTIPVIEATRLLNGRAGQGYSAQFSGGGRGPLSYAVDSNAIGSLPPGLSMNGAGLVSGTPTSSGEFSFGVSVRDADGVVSPNTVSIAVLPANGGLSNPLFLPGATAGTPYRQLIRPNGNAAPSLALLAAGSLPPGIVLDSSSAALNGTPTSPGDYFFTLNLGSDLGNAAFRISVAPAGSPSLSAVTNAASYERNGVAPGQVLTVFGSDLGPATLQSFQLVSNALPKELAGTRVLFDGVPAALIYTSAGQLSAIAPFGLLGRLTTNVTVEHNGTVSAPLTIPVVPAQPAMFTVDGSGSGLAAILNQDGTVNGPANPAAKGSVVVMYGTGGGRMTPSGVDGRVAGAVSTLLLAAQLQIGGQSAELIYIGNAPGIVEGVFQLNALVPGLAGNGSQPIRLVVGGIQSPAGVILWVQ